MFRLPAELQDGEILIRPFRPDDEEAVYEARLGDPEIARFIAGSPSPYTREHARWIVGSSTGPPGPGGGHSFAIVDRETGELHGAVTIRPPRLLAHPPELAYWLRRSSRGRGIATRALRLVVEWLVVARGVRKLVLATHPDNVASQRVAERVGFVRESVVADYADWQDGSHAGVRYVLRVRQRAR